MSDYRDQKRKAMSELVVDSISTGANAIVPGSGLAVKATSKALVLVFRKKIDREVDGFLEHLADAMGSETPEVLAEELEQKYESQATQNAVWEGFIDMMECVDEASKRCIALLLADYVKKADNPDSFYRRVGSILKNCSASELLAIKKITLHVLDVVSRTPSFKTNLVVKSERGNFWVVRPATPPPHDERAHILQADSASERKPADFSTAIRLLDQQGFGEKPGDGFGLHRRPRQGSSCAASSD